MSLAVSFLLQHGFRFDMPYTHGIPYLSRKDEDVIRASWSTRDAEKAAQADLEIKQEDMALIRHLRDSISAWQATPSEQQENYLNIPNRIEGVISDSSIPEHLNRTQIRLMHQTVRTEYPKLKTAGKGHFIQITIPTEEKQASEKTLQNCYRQRDLQRSIEFRWLIDAIAGHDITKMPDDYFLSAIPNDIKPHEDETPFISFVNGLQRKLRNRRRVIVGHNCFVDLVYLYSCFIGDLPENVEAFQEIIHQEFSAIIDTKFLASFDRNDYNTSLDDLERELRVEKTPLIELPSNFDRYDTGQSHHEAGYDSFLTATVAIKLSSQIHRDGKHLPQRDIEDKEKEPNAEPNEVDDDTVDEVFVTAPQSLADSESVISDVAPSVTSAFVKPLTTISKIWHVKETPPQSLCVDASEDSRRIPNAEDNSTRADDSTCLISEPLVVGKKPVDWSNAADVQRVKHDLEPSNLFGILGERGSGAAYQEAGIEDSEVTDQSSSDLMTFSDKKEEEKEEEGDVKSEINGGNADCDRSIDPKTPDMVEMAEMMPDWGDEFWRTFGNFLKINACREGQCHLPS